MAVIMESWIVVFKPETTKEDIDRFLEYVVSEGGEIKFIYESLNSFAAKLPNEFVTSLQSDMPPIIAYIEPDQEMHAYGQNEYL